MTLIDCSAFKHRNAILFCSNVIHDYCVCVTYLSRQSIMLSDCPRDLIDEVLLQHQKQQEEPNNESVLAQMTESHFNRLLLDFFFGRTLDHHQENPWIAMLGILLFRSIYLHFFFFIFSRKWHNSQYAVHHDRSGGGVSRGTEETAQRAGWCNRWRR